MVIERSEMATRPKAELALEAPDPRWQAPSAAGAAISARCLGWIPTSLRQRVFDSGDSAARSQSGVGNDGVQMRDTCPVL